MFNNHNKDKTEAPSVDEILSIEKALSERPSFSIRFRITLAFLVAFLFSFTIGLSSMIYISMMSSKQAFISSVFLKSTPG